jgi:hypothetical protein
LTASVQADGKNHFTFSLTTDETVGASSETGDGGEGDSTEPKESSDEAPVDPVTVNTPNP